MWPVSASWDAAWRNGGEMTVRAELWQSGQRVTLPGGATSLGVTSGTISVDESRKVRRQVTIGISDDVETLIVPALTDIRIWVGIITTDGVTEEVPVGVFRVADVTRPGITQPLEVQGSDWGWRVQRARLVAPWSATVGRRVTDEIRALIVDAIPEAAVYDLTGSTATIGRPMSWERERLDAVLDLCRGIGAEPVWLPSGDLVVRPVPTGTGAPVWTCYGSAADANLIDLAAAFSAERLYNAVIASSSAAGDFPVSAIVWQQSGPFAWPHVKIPRFFSSPVLTTVEQCRAAAAGILARSLALSRDLSPQAVPNPALDAGDVIAVGVTGDAMEDRIVSRLTIPLTPGPMQIGTRIAADAAVAAMVGEMS